MKLLFVARHAKSSWEDSALDDHSRPLNERGERNAHKMAFQLNAWQRLPQSLVSSSAKRALDTAAIFQQELVNRPEVVTDDRLYSEDWRVLVDVVTLLDDHLDSVMLIGHNPALTRFVRHCGLSVDSMPTSGVAVFAFTTAQWSEWQSARRYSLYYNYPKKLKK